MLLAYIHASSMTILIEMLPAYRHAGSMSGINDMLPAYEHAGSMSSFFILCHHPSLNRIFEVVVTDLNMVVMVVVVVSGVGWSDGGGGLFQKINFKFFFLDKQICFNEKYKATNNKIG